MSPRVWARAAALFGALAVAAGCATEERDASAVLPAATPPGAMQVVAPTHKEGDVWIDRIRGREREFAIRRARDDGTLEVSFWGTQMITDPQLNVVIYRSLTEEGSAPSKSDAPGLWFDFPLYEGKSWDQTFKWQVQDSMGVVGTTHMRGKVAGWEEVQVPAGGFKALRVDVNGRSHGRGGVVDSMKLTYWWAPEVSRFVKFDYHSTWEGTVEAELIAYRPAAGAR
jgi:hypothetical protein